MPRAEFHGYLKRLVDAGFADRIMFGSDQMQWRDAIRLGVEAVEAAPFLNDADKRAILCGNAARFLRLDVKTSSRASPPCRRPSSRRAAQCRPSSDRPPRRASPPFPRSRPRTSGRTPARWQSRCPPPAAAAAEDSPRRAPSHIGDRLSSRCDSTPGYTCCACDAAASLAETDNSASQSIQHSWILPP